MLTFSFPVRSGGQRFALGVTALMITSLALLTQSAQAQTIGFPLVNRFFDGDSATGVDVIVNQAFNTGNTLTSWSFFNNNPNLTQQVTPFLATQTSPGNFTISGVGTTRTNSGLGVQTFAFGLTSGSAAVNSSTFFGFHSGTTTTGQLGVVEVDTGQTAKSIFLFFSTTIGVGETRIDAGSFSDRFYSVQATATGVSAAPEPGSLLLMASVTGIGSCIALRRCRFRRASV